jgi:c-di-GMP-related signal transduction protein
VALPADLIEALVPSEKSTRTGDVLSLVIAYERADWQTVEMLSSRLALQDSLCKLPRFYQEALTWATTTAMSGRG